MLGIQVGCPQLCNFPCGPAAVPGRCLLEPAPERYVVRGTTWPGPCIIDSQDCPVDAREAGEVCPAVQE